MTSIKTELASVADALASLREMLFDYYLNRPYEDIGKDASYAMVLSGHHRFFQSIQSTQSVWGPVQIVSPDQAPRSKVVNDASKPSETRELVPPPVQPDFAVDRKTRSKRKAEINVDKDDVASDGNASESSGDDCIPPGKRPSSKRRKKN